MRVTSPIGAVSPHLDDLALSCAGYLAERPGSVLVTVFAGGPASVDPLPWWDRECGVVSAGDDVVGIRRAEDLEAATHLAAMVRHLEFWDNQYREARYDYGGPTTDLAERIAAALDSIIAEAGLERWLIPLGILHPDHQLAARAGLALVDDHPEIDWVLYEELPYATRCLRDRESALSQLAGRGYALEPDPGAALADRQTLKEQVVSCYRSQLTGLGDQVREALVTPERVHRLVRQQP